MDFTGGFITCVIGALGALCGYLVALVVASRGGRERGAFLRSRGGRALVLLPGVAALGLATTMRWGERVRERLLPRPPFERAFERQARERLASEPVFQARMRGKGGGEQGALVREMSRRGLLRLPIAELRRVGEIRRDLALKSERFCAQLWTGVPEPGAFSEALSRLPEPEAVEFARLLADAVLLEARDEGEHRAPPAGAEAAALTRTMANALGQERGAELVRIVERGASATAADGCKAVRLIFEAAPKLSDEGAAGALTLF